MQDDQKSFPLGTGTLCVYRSVFALAVLLSTPEENTLGLMGKIHITEDMSVEQVAGEVRSVFKVPMDHRGDFPFHYLQPTGSGSRTLSLPSVSSSFSWTAKQVARLGSSSGTIYILAEDDLTLDDEEVSINPCHVLRVYVATEDLHCTCKS